MTDRIRVATRRSQLAVWQAEHVAERLRALHPDLEVELVPLATRGDNIQDRPLSTVGGKGLFTRELELALRDGRAEIAVHSLKDIPVELPEDMALAAILERENPLDAFVSNRWKTVDDLPTGARVGTASLRRECQLRHARPDLVVEMLRGNVQTRLGKLDSGQFDAIILASAGLRRLGLTDRIASELKPELCLPAIGQGVIGIECLAADTDLVARLKPLSDPASATRVAAERALNRTLHGGCDVPLAGYAELEGSTVFLRARVGTPDGKQLLKAEGRGPESDPEAVGHAVAEDLLAQGAGEILRSLERR